MKWFFGGVIIGILFFVGIVVYYRNDIEREIINPIASKSKITPAVKEKKEELVDYSSLSFESLSKKVFPRGGIKLGKPTKIQPNFKTHVFTYQSDGKTISGMANIPNPPAGGGKFPVIVLLRGYADSQNYHIGLGTERSANFLAEHGFLTLAPDFLGYGYSDWEDKDILKARFYRPVEVLNLLSAIGSLPSADSSRIGLWGHSNGGQIALSILEITGKSYPTSLWAPMSLDFPESVLVYLGTEDIGNIVKEKVDQFLINNDPKNYSISKYFEKIKAPFIIHQATVDEMIKVGWTESLVEKLKNFGNTVDFYLYSKENHNFNRYEATGELIRQRDLEFFKKQLINF